MRVHFTLLRQLAGGGGGVVWLARDDTLNREVVIKTLHSSFVDSDAHTRFLREAQIAAQLEHPNIVEVYGLGRRAEDGAPFIIQRYIRGPTLRQAIRDYHEGKREMGAGAKGLRGLLQRLAPWRRSAGPAAARRRVEPAALGLPGGLPGAGVGPFAGSPAPRPKTGQHRR